MSIRTRIDLAAEPKYYGCMDPRKQKLAAYQRIMGKSVQEKAVPEKDAQVESPNPPAKKSRGRTPMDATAIGASPHGQPHKKSRGKTPMDIAAKGLLKVSGKEASIRKVAKFLILIGRAEAAKVLKHFSEEEIEKITKEIAQIKRVDHHDSEQVLREFSFFKKRTLYPQGGIDTARAILVKAFGEELGRNILTRSVPVEDQRIFSFLESLEPNQIFQLIRIEPPAVVAVILPFLTPEKASQILELFEPEYRTQLIQRLARKDKVSREVLLQIEEALRDKAHRQMYPSPEVEIDGKGILADILKYMDVTEEQRILDSLEKEAPLVAEELKDRLCTIDMLEDIDDGDLQKVLRSMSEKDIALLLKGKKQTLRVRILTNLSERRRLLVSEEYQFLGAVLKKEVEQATKDFLNTLKKLEEDGKIVIHRRGEILY